MKKENKECLYTDNILMVMKGKRQINSMYGQNIKNCTWYLKFCYSCGELIKTHRVDKSTCSDNCRQKLNRILNKGAKPALNKNNITKPTSKQLIKLGFAKREKIS